ncbi:hypothetical protein M4951_22770 [Blastopirellula sp. J2-11]|uniref:hypothetical protein n=1 Tax=Blastopirellula sp. J2-11 TaxID=2943192 RepID=UPI0021C8CB32|nr:hypothetical protein [Blastopirellula sp. J2-11]UUO06169.1 hypothetical protein M4951_22770 [Blastopirellula sp. J2-11]
MPVLIHRLCLPACLLWMAAVVNVAVAWEIEKFDLPQSPWSGFQDVVVDETGVPWVMANNHVYYFDGNQFVAIERSRLRSGQYQTGLYGGPKQGAYLTQPTEKDHEGKIYRLKAGRYHPITTFYYDIATNRPGVYVSKNGRLFNWGRAFLAVFDGANWKRVEGHFGERPGLFRPVICDLGDEVYFYSIHDNRIYGCNAANELDVTDGPAVVAEQMEKSERQRHFPTQIAAARWNGDRIFVLLQQPTQALAFDVRTKELIEVKLPAPEDPQLTFDDALETESGAVWLTTIVHRQSGHSIFELTPDGKINELPALQSNSWANWQHDHYPNSILETEDGVFVLGSFGSGIAIYRDGQLTPLGWKQGVFSGAHSIQQGLAGEVWLPCDHSGNEMARLTLGPGPPPTSEITKDWAEYKLARGSRLWTLPNDTIAMFDVEHPNQLSRLTADKVTFQQMPFEVTQIRRSIVDNRGHLLVELFPGHVFEISEDDVVEFESMKDALAAAVESGATHFQGSPDIGGLFLTADKRLWYGIHDQNTMNILTDGVWNTFKFDDDVSSLLESSEEGAIIRTETGKLYRYNTGQIQELPYTFQSRRDLMLGPQGLRPFDKKIAMQHPRQYYPVLKDGDRVRLYFDLEEFEQALDVPAPEPASKKTANLYRFFQRVKASRTTGSWLFMSPGFSPPYRVINRQLSKLDFSGTPLSSFTVNDVVEAANGDVWFVNSSSSYPRAFRLLQSPLSLHAGDIAEQCGRELEVPIEVKPDRIASAVDLLVTVDGKHQPLLRTPDGKLRFRFPVSGDYRCAVNAVRLGGTAPKPVDFKVVATVPLPETNWPEPTTEVTVTTSDWRPAVTATPTEEGRSAQLTWRFTEEPWRKFDKGSAISLIDRKPGVYTIEFRASEENYWHDQSPVVVKLNYDPDYELIVRELTQQLTSEDFAVQKNAALWLKQLGPKAIPHLKREIEAAESAVKALPHLRIIRERIEQAERLRDKN